MAGGGDRRTFVLALVGAGLGVLLLRFPFGAGTHGLWTWAIALGAFLFLGVPLMLGEAALGQFRRRNAVHALGPGPWSAVGGLLALGAVLAAALLAVLAGWAARYVLDSFSSSWFDDPDRHARLVEAGPDAMLGALFVVAVATGVALRGVGRGLRVMVAVCTIVALLLVCGVAIYANVQPGSSAGRDALFDASTTGLDVSTVVAALLAGLLPALLATGATATLSGQFLDRSLPREITQAVLYTGTALFLSLLALAAYAGTQDHFLPASGALQGREVPALLVSAGGAEGGFLLGAASLTVLLMGLVALFVLLEVPALWLTERFPSWTERRALLASGLVVYLLAIPFCFGATRVEHLEQGLLWVLAPLAGMLVSIRVGWTRPEVLEGFRIGDARHRLDQVLGPVLRFVVPPVLLILLVAGSMGFLRAVGWADGSGGLWSLAP